MQQCPQSSDCQDSTRDEVESRECLQDQQVEIVIVLGVDSIACF